MSADTAGPAMAAGVFRQLGALTRQLHDTLRELGHAGSLQGSVDLLPDATSRLRYIAQLTGQAADRVLGEVERAKGAQAQTALALDWIAQRLSLHAAAVPGAFQAELHEFLAQARQQQAAVDASLTEIMLAQDFHDLTGQVISRVVSMAAHLEAQLLSLLVAQAAVTGAPPEAATTTSTTSGHDRAPPAAAAAPAPAGDLQGPVIDRARTDVVTSQSQVDDLLASMGF